MSPAYRIIQDDAGNIVLYREEVWKKWVAYPVGMKDGWCATGDSEAEAISMPVRKTRERRDS